VWIYVGKGNDRRDIVKSKGMGIYWALRGVLGKGREEDGEVMRERRERRERVVRERS